ncbi:MAG TPA: thioredoxin domain-containing protein [Bacteroidetes bacterium]|nr:thioredoxin domain-containing protein [Bacteroidota bacterium]
MSNKLNNEKSPYLLQHANNPVDWFPWGNDAFEKAKRENKLIFLSIGYSTCHWCHVMERESFENESIAALMNKYFVNIKVDREERPDVDKVYMTAVQTMTGQGGWPLSVFLTPDLKPFYGGTYFPPKDGYNRPGFPSLLEKINEVWQNDRENIINSGDELIKSLQHRHFVDSKNTELDDAILKRTYHQIAAGYDPKFAGFGSGTKFPRPVIFNFLFRYYYRTKDQEALKMSLTTLMAMASGGMYDHLGGGFHRYSVDAQWRVPHFEKMLYDQAQLVNSYLDAYQITKDEFFATVARETCNYILRDMTSTEGGFFSAEDADSIDLENQGHKIEGAFYVWKKSEIESVLTVDEAKIFCYHYAVEENGNALSDPHQEFVGKNILFNPYTIEQTAEHFSLIAGEVGSLLSSAKRKLFEHRNMRSRPLCDDKVLTSWNGLMIGALARASRTLRDSSYLNAAVRAAEFIFTTLYDSEQKILSRRYREREVKFEAHLEDYTFLVSGLLDLYQATFDLRWLTWAEELTGRAITLFWDSAEGGFYDTSGKDTSILVRMKEAYDGAEPTGNSIAVMNLLRMYGLTNEQSLNDYAQKAMKHFCTMLDQSPQVMPQLMAAVGYFLSPTEHLVIVIDQPDMSEIFLDSISKEFKPNLNTILLNDSQRIFFETKLPFTKERKKIDGKSTAFFCRNYSCELPTNSVDELKRKIIGL